MFSWHLELISGHCRAGVFFRPAAGALMKPVCFVAVISLLLANAQPASAQLSLAKDNAVVYGHHHIAASDVAAHMKFFVDALGGTKTTFGPNKLEIVRFP